MTDSPRIQLRDFCGFRSGDKGDISDIALFAYDDDGYKLILREVTSGRVKQHFGSFVQGDVLRYEVPNVLALNFVMRRALGGGGPSSLRSDNLGKTLGGALVRMEIDTKGLALPRLRPRSDVQWAEKTLATLMPESDNWDT